MNTSMNVSSNVPVNVKILNYAKQLSPNNIVDLPVTELVDSQLASVIDSYRRNDFIGVFSPMVINFLTKKLNSIFNPDQDLDSHQAQGPYGTLGKVVAINYENGTQISSVRIQTFGNISEVDSMNAISATVIPGNFPQHQMMNQTQGPPNYTQLAAPPVSNAITPYQPQDADELESESDYESESEFDSDQEEGLKKAHLYSTKTLKNPDVRHLLEMPDEPKSHINAFERNRIIREIAGVSPKRRVKKLLKSAKRQEYVQLEQSFNNMSLAEVKDGLYNEITKSSLFLKDKTKPKLLKYDNDVKKSHLSSIGNNKGHNYPSAAAVSRHPKLQLPYFGSNAQKYLSGPTSAQYSTASALAPQRSAKLHKSKPKRPTITCLLIPVSEPVFPTLSIPDLRIINPIQKKAIIQMADNDQLIGLFYIKDSRFKSFDIITSPTDIHEFGVLARISSYSSYTDEETGLKPLLVSLITTSSAKIESIVPPKKTLNQTLDKEENNTLRGQKEQMKDFQTTQLQDMVCLGNVVMYSSKFSKREKEDIVDTTRKIIKKVSKLYYVSLKNTKWAVPEFSDKYLEILERNHHNMHAVYEGDPKNFDFYKVENDSVEMINIKLNVVIEIIKHYYLLKFGKQAADDSSIKLKYYLEVLQNVAENLKLHSKTSDVLNILEMELANTSSKLIAPGSKPNVKRISAPSDISRRPGTARGFDLISDTDSMDSESSSIQSPVVETPGAIKSPHEGYHINLDRHGSTAGITYIKDLSNEKEHSEMAPGATKLSPEDSSGTNDTLLSSFSEQKVSQGEEGPIGKDKINNSTLNSDGPTNRKPDVSPIKSGESINYNSPPFQPADLVNSGDDGNITHGKSNTYYITNNYYYSNPRHVSDGLSASEEMLTSIKNDSTVTPHRPGGQSSVLTSTPTAKVS
ncbi:hypothetical protein DASC09_047020 [Saccharomycopsis crataegensis]|uniref:Uncharacterized protein n=1 Tax=Saccharomycopsis crataegensis TaxID=43959 RepID=A0AAV5QR62_9ASCO|nr:hypothetical protein DASC09_047020 [Saccharomycopsis crataegensis]